MNRNNLIIILIIDLLILIGTIYLINTRYHDYKLRVPSTSQKKSTIQEKEVAVSAESDSGQISPSKIAKREIRNIMFQFKSSKIHMVSIIGDFNDWTPQALTKTKDNVWQIVFQLEPGEYKYNYVMNGKVVLDPNNMKPPVDNSRGFKSSVLTVKSLQKTKK